MIGGKPPMEVLKVFYKSLRGCLERSAIELEQIQKIMRMGYECQAMEKAMNLSGKIPGSSDGIGTRPKC